MYENNQLQFILTSEGRIMMQNEDTYEYQYFLKDHLGNTRITLSQNGTVLQEDTYYPFGMNIAGLSSANSSPEINTNIMESVALSVVEVSWKMSLD